MLKGLSLSQQHSHRSSGLQTLDNKMFRMPSFKQSDTQLNNQTPISSGPERNIKPIFVENLSPNQSLGTEKELQHKQSFNFKNNDQDLIDQIKLQRKLALLGSTSTVIIEEWKQGNVYKPRCVLDQQLDKDIKMLESQTQYDKFKRKQFRDSCGNLFE